MRQGLITLFVFLGMACLFAYQYIRFKKEQQKNKQDLTGDPEAKEKMALREIDSLLSECRKGKIKAKDTLEKIKSFIGGL